MVECGLQRSKAPINTSKRARKMSKGIGGLTEKNKEPTLKATECERPLTPKERSATVKHVVDLRRAKATRIFPLYCSSVEEA